MTKREKKYSRDDVVMKIVQKNKLKEQRRYRMHMKIMNLELNSIQKKENEDWNLYIISRNKFGFNNFLIKQSINLIFLSLLPS